MSEKRKVTVPLGSSATLRLYVPAPLALPLGGVAGLARDPVVSCPRGTGETTA
jgi:hypothetical protein